MYGDLFNSNEEYLRLNLNETEDVAISISPVQKESICMRRKGRFYENFKDERQSEEPVSKLGEIFEILIG